MGADLATKSSNIVHSTTRGLMLTTPCAGKDFLWQEERNWNRFHPRIPSTDSLHSSATLSFQGRMGMSKGDMLFMRCIFLVFTLESDPQRRLVLR